MDAPADVARQRSPVARRWSGRLQWVESDDPEADVQHVRRAAAATAAAAPAARPPAMAAQATPPGPRAHVPVMLPPGVHPPNPIAQLQPANAPALAAIPPVAAHDGNAPVAADALHLPGPDPAPPPPPPAPPVADGPIVLDDDDDDDGGVDLTATSSDEDGNPAPADPVRSSNDSVDGHILRPPPKPEQLDARSKFDWEEATMCPICMCEWSDHGPHRIVSLACGHLFGRSCIVRWLTPQVRGERKKCPKCNTIANRNDVRPLFPVAIVGVETEKLDELRAELNKERIAREELERRNNQLQMHLQMARAQCIKLEKQLADVDREEKRRKTSRIAHDPPSASPTWKTLDTVQIPIPGKYRLLSPTCDPDLLLLTHQSDHDDQNLLIYSVGANMPVVLPHVHTKLVRAVAVPPTGTTSLAATASMDATACLVQLRSQTIVARFALGAPGWSATFHSSDPNYLFFGQANDTVRMFDVRWPAAPLRDLVDPLGPRGGQFVHSVVHVGSSLVAASMRSVVEWRHLDGPATALVCAKVVVPPDVPANAQCFAVERCYGRAASFALAFRGGNVPAKYVVANVPAVGGGASSAAAATDPAVCSVVFPSPVMASNSPATLMTRFGMWAHGEHGAYLAAPNEAHRIIDLFEVDGITSKWDSCLDPKCAVPLLDTKPILLPDRVVLAGVNEQGQLHLFESGAE